MSLVVDVVIPTFRPGERLLRILEQLDAQTVRPRCVRIINTGREGLAALLDAEGLSEAELSRRYPLLVLEHITSEEFDHGGTRNRGFRACEGAEYVLTMTQDALPKDERLIERLLKGLLSNYHTRTPAAGVYRDAALSAKGDIDVRADGAAAMPGQGAIAVAYARQLPNEDASIEECLSRGFNYPAESRVKSEADLPELGIKTYFCSNVCALYRMDIWRALGGFPERAIFNEDMIYAARALKAGYRTAYAADAAVYHSHSYNARQQFHRNFDLGVSQAQNPQIFAEIRSESEGISYVKSVMVKMRRENKTHEIPGFIWRSGWRLVGFRLGKAYRKLPRALVIRCSSNRRYWQKENEGE